MSWLILLAIEHLNAEVKRRRAARARTVSIEQDVPETPPTEEVSTLGDEILDFYEPDEDLKLEDLVPAWTLRPLSRKPRGTSCGAAPSRCWP